MTIFFSVYRECDDGTGLESRYNNGLQFSFELCIHLFCYLARTLVFIFGFSCGGRKKKVLWKVSDRMLRQFIFYNPAFFLNLNHLNTFIVLRHFTVNILVYFHELFKILLLFKCLFPWLFCILLCLTFLKSCFYLWYLMVAVLLFLPLCFSFFRAFTSQSWYDASRLCFGKCNV